MSARPVATRWFEVLAPRLECSRTLEILADTGAVQIEVRPHPDALPSRRELGRGLSAMHKLRTRYDRYWSRGSLRHSPTSRPPRLILEFALHRIADWREEADPVIAKLQAMEQERTLLGRCWRWLSAFAGRPYRVEQLRELGPVMTAVPAMFPVQTEIACPANVVCSELESEGQRFVLFLLPVTARAELLRQITAWGGQWGEWPTWVSGTPEQAARQLSRRLAQLQRRILEHYAQLDTLHVEFGLADALGDVACLDWFLDEIGALEPATENFAWVTGWTPLPDARVLQQALQEGGVPALARFSPPPEGVSPPLRLVNRAWARPFEMFATALGTPGRDEVDPSPILAWVVPLLFGYMFGDLGQGLVLVALGVWLLRRWPGARMLIGAGLSAALFGLLFGTVFAREDLLPALWLHPLHQPVFVLGLPILVGAGLLVLGQMLDALEAGWRGEQRHWLLTHGGLLVLYIGAVSALMNSELMPLLWLGLSWHLLGHMLAAGHVRGLVTAFGSLFEDGMRLLVNTVSFARVGAFALAHAGLSAALMTLADGAGNGLLMVLIMLAGNLLVILLEGLVVSVQTTRLVLFEFFMRFLRGEGRLFRPLPPPPTIVRGRYS